MAEDNRRTSAPPDAAVNDRVAEVASRMPFGKTFIEDYAEGVLQIDLGATGEDEGHDRAGIDGTGPEYRWWVETPYGDRQEWSDLGFDADPTEVATWVTRQALTLNSPAATFRREITPVQLDEQQIDTLRHELLDYAEWINTAEFTDAEVRDAAARGHRLDVPMDMYTGLRGISPRRARSSM
ncbi:hypothetical protein ACFOEP_13100 [Microbacterium amylolyticum]|uniref:hypothetical protein n=1 Tax=Microbacterium amylolyticum TaxID=936337 RepID=UPI003614FAD4